jgi:hypothetical protein
LQTAGGREEWNRIGRKARGDEPADSTRIDRVDYGRNKQGGGVSGAKLEEHAKAASLCKEGDEIEVNEQYLTHK